MISDTLGIDIGPSAQQIIEQTYCDAYGDVRPLPRTRLTITEDDTKGFEPVIVIDLGHNIKKTTDRDGNEIGRFFDRGTAGRLSNGTEIAETDIIDQIGFFLADYLAYEEYEVAFTRYPGEVIEADDGRANFNLYGGRDNMGLRHRYQVTDALLENGKFPIFISLHADGSEHGGMDGYRAWYAHDRQLADTITGQMHNLKRDGINVDVLNPTRLGKKFSPWKLPDYVPAAILEQGFLTNGDDLENLMTYNFALAEYQAKGLMEYIENFHPDKKPNITHVQYYWQAFNSELYFSNPLQRHYSRKGGCTGRFIPRL